MINQINEMRIQAKKSPVGFLNPTLYENPKVMNDIKNGSNPGCGTAGFAAAPGWDPLTGESCGREGVRGSRQNPLFR